MYIARAGGMHRSFAALGMTVFFILSATSVFSAVNGPYPCTDSKNGCSNASAIQRRKRAASAPSINR